MKSALTSSLLTLLAVSLALAAAAPGLAAPGRPAGPPHELWQKYPLGTKKLAPPSLSPTRPAARRQEPVAPPILVPSSGSEPAGLDVPLWAVLLAALGLSCLIALAGETIVSRARRLALRLRRRLVPVVPPPATDGRLVADAVARLRVTAAAAGYRDPKLVAVIDAAGASAEWRPLALATAVDSWDDPSQPAEAQMTKLSNTDDVPNRVAAVLLAAEEVAEQIRQEAREEAAAIRGEAEKVAAARIEQLTQAAQDQYVKAEAYSWDLRETSQSYAVERRRDADEEAARIVAEAEAQARSVRQAAEAENVGSLTEALSIQRG